MDYVTDLKAGKIPNNISVNEFFLKSGDWLNNPNAQQHYINSNYTHIARDMAAKGINIICQAIAVREEPTGEKRYSLSCNSDLSVDILDLLKRDVIKVKKYLPWCYQSWIALYASRCRSVRWPIRRDYYCPIGTHTLFSTPNMKISLTDYAIGLHTSSLC